MSAISIDYKDPKLTVWFNGNMIDEVTAVRYTHNPVNKKKKYVHVTLEVDEVLIEASGCHVCEESKNTIREVVISSKNNTVELNDTQISNIDDVDFNANDLGAFADIYYRKPDIQKEQISKPKTKSSRRPKKGSKQ